MMRRSGRTLGLGLVFIAGLTACDPRPFPPPAIESFVHSRDIPPLGTAADSFDEAEITLVGPDALRHVMTVKVAHRQGELALGAAGIADVPAGTGVLLLHPEELADPVSPAILSVALDHAFIASSGEILAVLRVAPCRPSSPCVVVDPELNYRAVLVVRAGWLVDQGIERGSFVEIGPITPAEG